MNAAEAAHGAPIAPGSARKPWGTLLTTTLALAVFSSNALEARLIFDRAAILHGEPWRLWTGNWVHFGTSHLLWNLAVLVPAGCWAERLAPARTRWLLLLAPAVIGVTLLVFEPALSRYAGLSGVAAGILTLLALVQLARRPEDRWLWRLVLALLGLKIAAESFAGHALFAQFNDADLHPSPLAHVAGMVCAVAVQLARRRI